MSAKESDLLRIQEIYDVATQTQAQVEELGFSRGQFVSPKSARDELIAEGLINRVFRVTEEGCKLSGLFAEYGFDRRAMNGIRNRLAHAYGTIDMDIVRDVLEVEFPKLADACVRYCEDEGIDLRPTWGNSES